MEWFWVVVAVVLGFIVVSVGLYLRNVVKEVNKELDELIDNWGSKL